MIRRLQCGRCFCPARWRCSAWRPRPPRSWPPPPPCRAASAPSHAAASAAPAKPGLYHVPIIGKVSCPAWWGRPSAAERHRQRSAARHGGVVVQLGRLRRHRRHLQLRLVVVDRADGQLLEQRQPHCGLLGFSSLLGGPGAASAFWVGLDGYNSTSVEQLGTDSDCDSGTSSYYAWYEMYPNPSVTLPSQYPVQPGDQMSASVTANAAGTSFTLAIKDATAGWSYSTAQTGSGFARSSAEVIAEAPSSCTVLFCSEVPLADSGRSTSRARASSTRPGPAGRCPPWTPTRSPWRTTGRPWPRRAA